MKLTPSFLDGAFLAVNSIPGWVAIIDAPRCETERMYTFDHTHDWLGRLCGEGAYARDRRIYAVDWTGFKGVTGTEDALQRVIAVARERNPGRPILLYRGLMSHLINTDVEGIAAAAAPGGAGPVMVVPQRTIDSDWMDGWRATHEAVWRHLLRDEGDRRPHLTGLCLFRLEGDERGNVLEIERLLGAVGVPEWAWAFGGRPLAPTPVARAAPRVVFPHGAAGPEPPVDAAVLPVPLPLGLEGTSAFVSAVGARFDRADRAEALVAREVEEARERLAPLVTRALAGRAVCVVADDCSASGLWAALREVGVEVAACAILRRASAPVVGRAAMEAAGTEVWCDPSYQDVQQRLDDLARQGGCHAVVGSAILRDAAAMADLPYVECTAPHALEHFAAANPYLGFEGAVRLAERLANALLQHEHRRQFERPRR